MFDERPLDVHDCSCMRESLAGRALECPNHLRSISPIGFASQLLMPEAWVREAWRKMPHLGRLAWRFGVSHEAMRVRLAELGLVVVERSNEE